MDNDVDLSRRFFLKNTLTFLVGIFGGQLTLFRTDFLESLNFTERSVSELPVGRTNPIYVPVKYDEKPHELSVEDTARDDS